MIGPRETTRLEDRERDDANRLILQQRMTLVIKEAGIHTEVVEVVASRHRAWNLIMASCRAHRASKAKPVELRPLRTLRSV